MSEETLGQRIRRARQERGLSLAQVAGEDFSRAFLNQVEMGRSQPSTRVLRVIASRLGAPLDYLVEGVHVDGELAVERGRLALTRGRPRRALELVRPALEERPPVGTDARLCAAEALLGLGRDQEAGFLVQEAVGRDEALLRARGDSHRLHRLAAARSGRRVVLDAAAHERLGDRALRQGQPHLALEHLRAARILREATPALASSS